jgi:uncharacterized protein (TIGR04141 family)
MKLPDGFKLLNPSNPPDPKKYCICLAIMSDISGPLELPFFSKVSLKYTVKQLRNMGFINIVKTKIEI